MTITPPGTARPRARDLGIPFEGTPGPLNAITDVAGVEVGHRTLLSGDPGRPDVGPVVRTGVTVVHPLGKGASEGVAAGRFVLNGMGEMTGSAFLDEYGVLHGPMALTGTTCVGVVRDALVAWSVACQGDPKVVRGRTKPVVAETWDGRMNDAYGQHVTRADAFAALDGASGGPVAEGTVGGGTGMTSFGFAAGIGTASRQVAAPDGPWTLGALVQANFGSPGDLRIAGVPFGAAWAQNGLPREGDDVPDVHGDGSVVVVIATDAPLLPSQLASLAKRPSLALGRVGSIAATSSGDLFLAFSTANRVRYLDDAAVRTYRSVPHERVDPLLRAAVEATEEAIVNALVAAEVRTGVDGFRPAAFPSAAVARHFTSQGVPERA